MHKPFSERRIGPCVRVRTFAPDTAHRDLIWHRDREDRLVRVLEGKGWSLQLDGGLPLSMDPGTTHLIPRGMWHRVLRGHDATVLRAEIKEVHPSEALVQSVIEAFFHLQEKGDKKKPGNPDYYVGKKTLGGKSNKQMAQEIEKCAKEPRPKSCYDEWSADKTYKKKKESHELQGEDLSGTDLSEGKLSKKTRETLKKKAEKANMPLGVLTSVYQKGLAAWLTGHRQGTPQHAWAMGRVNSFISGGKARKVDSAEWEKVQKHRKKK